MQAQTQELGRISAPVSYRVKGILKNDRNGMRQKRDEEADRFRQVLRTVRKAEIGELDRKRADVKEAVGDVGTGFTILRRSDSPITRLLNSRKIGSDELQAAEDICLAFRALAGELFLKPISLERRDRSNSPHESARVIDAISRYQAWARLWSIRAKLGDPTLAIVIDTVWDERPFRICDQDYNLRNGRSAEAVAAGLRDYAARAGWVQGAASRNWLVSEGAVFRLRRDRSRVNAADGRK